MINIKVETKQKAETKQIIRRSQLFRTISSNLVWPDNPSYDNPIVAFRYDVYYDINF